MGTTEIILRLLAGVALTAMNAFFVAIEFALTRLRQLDRSALGQSAGGKKAWEMTERLEFYLTGCQVGISLSSILLGVVLEPAVSLLLEPVVSLLGVSEASSRAISVVVAITLIQFIHKVWGEQTPTYLGVERPALVARWCSRPLWWWSRISYPFIIAGDSVAKWTLGLFGVKMTRSWTEVADTGKDEVPQAGSDEFRSHLLNVLSGAHVSRERREEIVAAYEIGETGAEEIMVPRDDVVALHADRSFAENLEVIQSHGFTRYPLVGRDVQDFRGVVYTPTILAHYEELRAEQVTLSDLAAEPVRVESGTSVAKLVDILQEKRQELAMICRGNEILGLVTATDAFEAIIGNLEDPLDDAAM